MKKTLVRVLAIVLAVLMAVGVLASVVSSLSASAASLSQTQLDALGFMRQDIQQDLNAVASKINSLEYAQYALLEKKKLLDDQVELAQAEADNIAQQISIYDQYIEDLGTEITECRQAEVDELAALKVRIRAMEENGNLGYADLLMSAPSFPEFVRRLTVVLELKESDNEVYAQMQTAKENTQAAIDRLSQAQVDQVEIQSELARYQQIVLEKVDESTALISEILADPVSHEEEYSTILDGENALQKEVDDMVVELERQEQAKNSTNLNKSTNRYIWPLTGQRQVLTPFGTNYDEAFGTYVTHYGIDINAEFGEEVLASDTGTVAMARYDAAYGYYILMSHGSGNTTLYAHLSKIAVSEGETVPQGTIIGYAGATGAAQQVHLHFEVRQNGVRVNPAAALASNLSGSNLSGSNLNTGSNLTQSQSNLSGSSSTESTLGRPSHEEDEWEDEW